MGTFEDIQSAATEDNYLSKSGHKSSVGAKGKSKTEQQSNHTTLQQPNSLKHSDASSTSLIQSMHEKVMISGDDILIEYAERLVQHLKKISEVSLKPHHKTMFLKFITHYVWHNPDRGDPSSAAGSKFGGLSSNMLWARIANRVQEMRERRRRLIKMQFKKEGRLVEFERCF